MTGTWGAAASRPAGPPRTLGREHELLLAQVTVRAGDELTATAGGRWPSGELRALAGYLRTEVRAKPKMRSGSCLPRLIPCRASLGWDVTMCACVRMSRHLNGPPPVRAAHSRTEVAALTRDLLAQLKRHLAAEEAALAEADAPDAVPATTSAVTHQHGWYPLTEGPVIDLDRLPPEEMADAAVDRLQRLRHGEQVELRSCHDIDMVWQRMDQLEPGGCHYLVSARRSSDVRIRARAAATMLADRSHERGLRAASLGEP